MVIGRKFLNCTTIWAVYARRGIAKGILLMAVSTTFLARRPGQAFHHVWEELGALPARPVINHAELMRIVGADG